MIDINGICMEAEIQNICQEDDTCTVTCNWPEPLALEALSEKASHKGLKKIFMKKLGVLVVISDGTTVHLHQDGRIIVNMVSSIEGAEQMLRELL